MDFKKTEIHLYAPYKRLTLRNGLKVKGWNRYSMQTFVKTNLLVCLHREKAEPILDDSMKTFKYELYKTVVLNSKYKTYL